MLMLTLMTNSRSLNQKLLDTAQSALILLTSLINKADKAPLKVMPMLPEQF